MLTILRDGGTEILWFSFLVTYFVIISVSIAPGAQSPTLMDRQWHECMTWNPIGERKGVSKKEQGNSFSLMG